MISAGSKAVRLTPPSAFVVDFCTILHKMIVLSTRTTTSVAIQLRLLPELFSSPLCAVDAQPLGLQVH